jgi:hypothetical protein
MTMRRLTFLVALVAAPLLIMGVNPAAACDWGGGYGYGYGSGYGYGYRPAYGYGYAYRPRYAYASYFRPRFYGYRRWGGWRGGWRGRRW